ncbi:MAG: TetR/AcrR family transcriptional regulator [Syntrophobacterales bacterium]|nr:TetR/AcrR family transcriptional regulator [Syntrophobacterales bacterium]
MIKYVYLLNIFNLAMNRREASKQETRQLILRAARRLFAQKGLEGCTIRDIARRAGVSPASVVVHFKSKTALLEEALKLDIDQAMTKLMASLPGDSTILERLMHLAKGFFRLYDQNRDLYRALIRQTIFEPDRATPDLSRQSEQYIQFLSILLAEEKVRGNIRAEVNTEVAAGAIFSLYLGALIMLFRKPEMTVEMVAAALAAMTDSYLKGITKVGRLVLHPKKRGGP